MCKIGTIFFIDFLDFDDAIEAELLMTGEDGGSDDGDDAGSTLTIDEELERELLAELEAEKDK